MLVVAPWRGRAVLYRSPCSHWRSLPGLGWQLTMSQYYCPPYTWHPTLHTIASIIHWYQTHDNRVRVGISLQKMLSSFMKYSAKFFALLPLVIEWCLSDPDQELASVSPQKADHATSCEIVTQWGEEEAEPGCDSSSLIIITNDPGLWTRGKQLTMTIVLSKQANTSIPTTGFQKPGWWLLVCISWSDIDIHLCIDDEMSFSKNFQPLLFA